ncbi:arylsulfatase [Paraglaciecola chathamensis]|uniref:Arylsulfatase n=1 Tax=Paraglaciecola chathamensis TaxID=368405 RepID=A0A8H9M295_9ALTE|nr:arylsulfatase [Paraglaciecola oceanifecundans]GGZ79181.1 arylsulfatase [Paraglaciecola oceanifecundans]
MSILSSARKLKKPRLSAARQGSIDKTVGITILLLALLGLNACSKQTEQIPELPTPSAATGSLENKPNVVVILADDLGYSDLGYYGSEIDTPNLDALARDGVAFSQFHAASACSPTRAMLLTGIDHHLVGLGAMEKGTLASNQKGIVGYEGELNHRAATMGELFNQAGYSTYITGKWHLGEDAMHSPPAFGFNKSFVQLEGGAGHFNALPGLPFRREAKFRENGKRSKLPKNFYSSDFYVDKMIDYVDEDRSANRPFLAYLAMTAPHWPLQAKSETIEKYAQQYVAGFEKLAQRRSETLVEKGIVKQANVPKQYEKDEVRQWSSLSETEKQYEAKRMAVYAAMIDDMDSAIGRFITYLKQTEQFENTLFVFMSDNGAEGHTFAKMPMLVGLSTMFNISCCNNDYDNIGNADSFIPLGPEWVSASNAPFRLYKGFPTQGGIVVPAFISGKGIERSGWSHEFFSVKDILPTLLDFTQIDSPHGQFAGRAVLPIEGKSMKDFLQNTTDTLYGDSPFMGWELFSKHAVRFKNWKLLNLPEPYGDGRWRLYDLSNDPSELHDLSSEKPNILAMMKGKWAEYQQQGNVIIGIDGPIEY